MTNERCRALARLALPALFAWGMFAIQANAATVVSDTTVKLREGNRQ